LQHGRANAGIALVFSLLSLTLPSDRVSFVNQGVAEVQAKKKTTLNYYA
jgi:hypothetical protein